MNASALYEAPFSNMHGGGPDELFSDKENVIEAIFKKLEKVKTGVTSMASWRHMLSLREGNSGAPLYIDAAIVARRCPHHNLLAEVAWPDRD